MESGVDWELDNSNEDYLKLSGDNILVVSSKLLTNSAGPNDHCYCFSSTLLVHLVEIIIP